MFLLKELLTEIDARGSLLNRQGEQVSGRLNELERKEFENRLVNLNEESRTAKRKLTEQRGLLEDGISSCMKQLKVMEQAKEAAKEVDQVLSEINAAKENDLESVERKTEVKWVHLRLFLRSLYFLV